MSHVYPWLVDNNLWKATVSWAVGFILGGSFAWVPWKRHRDAQKEILRRLREHK